MTPKRASLVQVEIIKACLIVTRYGEVIDEAGDDGWIRYEYWDGNIHLVADFFFYSRAPMAGFFALRADADGLQVLDTVGCLDTAGVSSPGVFMYISGSWEDRVFARSVSPKKAPN